MLRRKANETDRFVVDVIEETVVDSFTIEELRKRKTKAEALVAQHQREIVYIEELLVQVNQLKG